MRPWRDLLLNVVPPWMATEGKAGKLAYAAGVLVDVLQQCAIFASCLDFPGALYELQSLDYSGADRLLKRFDGEGDASYAARQILWIDTWRSAGTTIALLRQLQLYWAVYADGAVVSLPRLRFVQNNGIYFEAQTDGTWVTGSSAWDWDGDETKTSRFWIVVYPDPAVLTYDGLFDDDGIYGDLETQPWLFSDPPESWAVGGIGQQKANVSKMRGAKELVTTWRCPHARCDNLIYCFSEELTTPSGNWDRWENRDPQAIYTGAC